MRKNQIESIQKDEPIRFLGEENARLNNLIDAVFGIALALLTFSVTDANSFSDLLIFAKSFPAILVSIILLYLVWKEHVSFNAVFNINGFKLQLLNLIFIALVIFYVYPLRFMTKLLTSMFFKLDIDLSIKPGEIPDLMIYYGAIAFAIYFTLYFCYSVVLKQDLKLTEYEIFYTQSQKMRMLMMAAVPFVSLIVSLSLKNYSIPLASALGGMSYALFPLFIGIWKRKHKSRKSELLGNPS